MHWCRPHAQPRCRGEVLLCLPLWEFKGLKFWVLGHSWCICPHPWQIIALNPVSIIPLLVWIWLFLAVSLFWLLPCCWDHWLLVLWLFLFWPILEPYHCFFSALWAPLTAAISCYCILTHFDQGSYIDDASLTMPNVEAYEVLCSSCSCLASAFLVTCIRAM